MTSTIESTEYGTRKSSVSIAINVPYMLRSIGNDYSRILNIQASTLMNDTGTFNSENLNEIESVLGDMKKKVSIIQGYFDRSNHSIYDYKRSRYREFYQRNLDEFIETYEQVIDANRRAIEGEG